MSRIIAVIILFLMVSIHLRSYSQEAVDLDNPAFKARYENFDYQGQFAVKVLSDETNNYFLLDFNQLVSLFEKIYFINQTFSDDKVVNLEPNLKYRNIWFLANKKHPVEDVLKDFRQMKIKTTEMSEKMSLQEKESWMKTNNKYQ